MKSPIAGMPRTKPEGIAEWFDSQQTAMSGHTQGPWTVHPYRARVCPLIELDEPVAELLWPTKVRSEAETFANARLIAAAPELLEACRLAEAFISIAVPERAVDRNEAIDDVLPKLRAAIAKAVQP